MVSKCAVVLVFIVLSISTDAQHKLSKRYLLFPRYTQMQCSTGLTVPLVLPRRSINLSLVGQANYFLPWNVSNLTPQTIAARDKTSFFYMGRRTVYKYIMTFLDSFGLDGEQCLLRSICEISETPLHIKHDETLLEKLVHFIFTPSLDLRHTRKASNSTSRKRNFSEKLLLAEKIGKNYGDCSDIYSDCLVSLTDLFTIKFNIYI
ncbi:unnamed protein product [Psylliodes chrysocephalus]|uniref:Uncharacterized protein n=1 Tax=Psylliodes chrysocephalus TaxID=3402493 RepID=A0A9P0DBM6_9CUCU|nr:unnamed protein product [Psylliodes chrysocephala]